MIRSTSLAVVLFGALAAGAGFATASASKAAAPQQGGSPIERLERLEAQIADLKAQVAKLEARKPESPPSTTGETPAAGAAAAGTPASEQAELAKQLEQVLAYLAAQAEAAKQLDAALAESREKGFTYGINPDSRIVLLDGFGQFTTTLQTDVPSAKPAPTPQASARSARR